MSLQETANESYGETSRRIQAARDAELAAREAGWAIAIGPDYARCPAIFYELLGAGGQTISSHWTKSEALAAGNAYCDGHPPRFRIEMLGGSPAAPSRFWAWGLDVVSSSVVPHCPKAFDRKPVIFVVVDGREFVGEFGGDAHAAGEAKSLRYREKGLKTIWPEGQCFACVRRD